jgi:protein-L-isoaspartate(D-aspartate) O-methyltransferase
MADRSTIFASTLGITDRAVLDAFAATPRHLFLPGSDLDDAYRDDAVPTRWANGRPTSSSTQPSLMATMIEGLALRPGMRVLEIGAGTGYNAAVIARLTGAPVVSIDVQADVVLDARAALARADVSGVRVEHADGYAGFPATGPYERIIVTCGIRGVPPGWLTQLDAGGFALVPLAHGGLHPLIRVSADARASVHYGHAGFMHAAGPLFPKLADDFPAPRPDAPHATLAVRDGRLAGDRHSFWFAAAAIDRRITCVDLANGWAPALIGESAMAWFTADEVYAGELPAERPTAAAGAGGDGVAAVLDEATALLDRWEALGQPPARAWSTTLLPAPGLPDPLLVATSWILASSR